MNDTRVGLADVTGIRNAGFVACLLGVLLMISGRFMAGAPAWLVYVGVSVIVFGWGLLGLSMFKRAALVPGPDGGTEGKGAKT